MPTTRFRLRIEHLWGLTILAGIFVFVNTHPIRPHDFWWHITIGREILNSGKIPIIDIYSSTASGQPYPSYQMFWLMDIVLFSIYKLGGPALVVFFQSLLITSAYAVIIWISKEVTNSWRIAAFGVLFAAALGLNDWNVRPQGITLLLASLYLLAIFEYKQSNNWVWLLVFPLGMLVWANSHGTFLIGIALIGIWLGQELWDLIIIRLRREQTYRLSRLAVPGIVFAVTSITCLVNPRGLGIIDYIKTLTGNTAVQNLVTEWSPPKINTLIGAIFFTGVAIAAILFALSPKRPNLSQLITFIVFGVLGLRTSRGSVWFGIVMAPILAGQLSSLIQKYQRGKNQTENKEGSRVLNVVFSIVILATSLVTLPWFKDALPFPPAKAGLISYETPIRATQVLLEKNPPGELFNAISFGSYLIWAAYPEYRVFVDSRIELFPQRVWMDYLAISNAEGNWEALLDYYGVNTLMISPVEQPRLIVAVNKSGKWNELYRDDATFIYRRR